MSAPRKYPLELMERGARMVLEMCAETGVSRGAVARVAKQLGVHPEALRHYVRQAEVTLVNEPERRAVMRRGSRSWSVRTASCAGPMRSCARRRLFRGGARPPTQQVIGYIDAHRAEFGVEPICRVLAAAGVAIAPSSYYAAKTRPPSAQPAR